LKVEFLDYGRVAGGLVPGAWDEKNCGFGGCHYCPTLSVKQYLIMLDL
jgi:hypothetical protein